MYDSIRAAQNPLFIETLEEALAALAAAIGGKKKLAVFLRPDVDDEGTAYKWLLDVLSTDPDRRAVFHAIHLIRACRIAREHNVHFLKHWFDHETGYKPSEIAAAPTPEQELAVQMRRAVEHFQRLADEAAALRDPRPENLRAVR